MFYLIFWLDFSFLLIFYPYERAAREPQSGRKTRVAKWRSKKNPVFPSHRLATRVSLHATSRKEEKSRKTSGNREHVSLHGKTLGSEQFLSSGLPGYHAKKLPYALRFSGLGSFLRVIWAVHCSIREIFSPKKKQIRKTCNLHVKCSRNPRYNFYPT